MPVKLHRAARAEKVSFRQLVPSGTSRVKQVYIAEDDEISEEPAPAPDQSVRGLVPIRGKAPMAAPVRSPVFVPEPAAIAIALA